MVYGQPKGGYGLCVPTYKCYPCRRIYDGRIGLKTSNHSQQFISKVEEFMNQEETISALLESNQKVESKPKFNKLVGKKGKES